MPVEYCAAIQGDFSVDQNGSAVYSVPIQVPPGTGGMQPSLAFLYHSTVTDGMLGVGWNLQGLSAITRTPKTPAQDRTTVKSALHHDRRDRFALDGQRLMVVAGEYGSPGAEYRTEVESFRKVTTLHAQNESEAVSFIVMTKEGVRYEYGTTADSRIRTGGEKSPVRVWALSRMTDRCGNFLTISYQRDPVTSAYYPAAIEYTGNAGLVPQRKVQFDYEPRPRLHPRFEAGCRIDSTLRLKEVVTSVQGGKVLAYALGYSLNKASGRSQLESVVYADALGARVLPTRFDWLDMPQINFSSPVSLAEAVLKSGSAVIPLDVSGSGRRDLVGVTKVTSGGIALQLLKSEAGSESYSATTQAFPSLPWSELGLMPMDIDGDGRTELLHIGQRNGKLALTLLVPREQDGVWSFVQGALFAAGPADLPYGGVLIPMDVNGDGRIDLVYCYSGTDQLLRLQTLISNGSRFEAGALTLSTLRYSPTAQFLPVEFDGDGMADLLYAYADQSQGQQRLGMRIFVSDGRGFMPAFDPLPAGTDLPFGGSLMPARLKEDAHDDLVYAYAGTQGKLNLYTLFGTGIDYRLLDREPKKTSISYNGWVLPSAVRGAGMTELLVATQTSTGELSAQMIRWNGNGFDDPEACMAADAKPLRWGGQIIPADVTGRGKTDLLYGLQSAGDAMKFQVYAAPPEVPGRLRCIQDGFGGRIEIAYKPLTDSAIYAKGTDDAGSTLEAQSLLNAGIGGSAWPMRPGAAGTLSKANQGAAYALTSRQFPEYVVAEYAIHDNRGHRYGFRYRYTGCRLDMAGRGWLGFASREAIHIDEDISLTEEYQQHFPVTGLVASATLRRATDGALLSRSVSSVTVTGHKVAMTKPLLVTWQGDRDTGVYRTEVTGLIRQHFTPGKMEPDVTENEIDQYDSFGNLIERRSEASNRPPLYFRKKYEIDVTKWLLGNLVREDVSADAEGRSILQRSEYVYDPATGKQHEQRLWDDQHERWLTSRQEYDRFGNPVAEVDCSGARTETSYDSVFHSFCSRKILPANADGKTAELQFAHEPKFGQEIKRTDANGLEWKQNVDGLGRIIETAAPGPDGKSVTIARVRWNQDNVGFYKETLQLVSWTEEGWYWRRNYEDSLGREYRIATLSPDGKRQLLVDRTHSASGQILKASLPYFEGEQPSFVERQFDVMGRVTREVEPSATGELRVIEFSYPHLGREIRTDSGRTTTSEYVTYLDEPALVKSTDAEGAVNTYAYDSLGRMIAATDPAGVETRSRYDSLGRRSELKVALKDKTFASEIVARDDVKRTVRITSAQGHTIEILRDGRNRILQRKVNSGDTTTWQYDVAKGRLAGDRLAAVVMPEGHSYTYSYDTLGNVSEEVLALEGERWLTRRDFGPAGNVMSVTHPDGSTVRQSFTTAGQLTALDFREDGAGFERVAEFADFTPLMRPGTVSYGNGLIERFEFSRTGQLSSQTLKKNDAFLAHTRFQWNKLHELTKIEDRITAARTQNFSYDRVGRLAGVKRGEHQSIFAYDHSGNLVLKDGVSYAYEGQQAVSGKKGGELLFSSVYDADGNMQQSTHGAENSTYRYDGLGRLTASGAATFLYDHTGRRLIKKSGKSTTLYVSTEFEATVFANGAREYTRYLCGTHGLVAQITRAISSTPAPRIAGVPSAGIRYIHTNQVNSTALHTGRNGEITGQVEYRPFGEIDSISGEDDFRRKFTGKELDSETGLYYFHARYYDPRIGRFISGDDRAGGELERADSMNRYAYVLNSPITGIDFDGHFRWDIVADIALGVAAVTLIAAATIMTGGAAAALVGLAGSTLLGAAVSGSFNSASQSGDNFSWGQWGTEVGIGAATGFISGGITGGGVALGAKVGAYALAKTGSVVAAGVVKVLLGAAVGALSGTVSGITGNALRNISAGRNGWDNWETAARKGAWQGAISGSAAAFFGVVFKPGIAIRAANNQITGSSVARAGVGALAVLGVYSAVAYASESESRNSAGRERGGGSQMPLGQPVRPSSRPSLRFTPAY